ncbi:GGDEF domain-containing protein [Pseudomonas agarici]|uniref:GGDEF domain-containing protein n=1 Tax=Pseudomonas agarici TaxID=46677 RepID=UPI0002E0F121|nr:GGDEF domain-containing protein [Pseudomonas agarici]NWB89901.1 diguanylate cyclase [Pseudomonas agarici]NWC07350.1 diguanylate cyclase [Pseudomonas agarici]SEK47438.1 diguanylate cyclase with PAS/PAC and GAF sensors [Pseudomonas agarici]
METKTVTPLASYIDLLLDVVCAVDIEGRFVFVSAACERIFGYTPAELIGTSMIELVLPADRERTLKAAGEIMAGEPKPHFENRYVRKDGRVVHIMWSARWSEADQLRIAVARDVTERKLAEAKQVALYAISEAAHATEDLLTLFQRVHRIIGEWLPAQNFCVALYDASRDQLSFPYHIDDRRVLCHVDSHCSRIVRGGLSLLLNEEDAPCLGVPLTSQNGIIGALLARSSDGQRYTEHDQDLLQFVSAQVAAAIERKQLHARLQYMARYDQLTHLPNRAFLHERLKAALARARCERGQLALLYVDLDKFKQVNDNFGHGVGDLLLQEVARRLQQCVGETDTVARIGGDEFIVLLEQLHLRESAAEVADKIRRQLNEPMIWQDCELRVTPSIGIALYPQNGEEAQQLFKHADEAMYGVKRGDALTH